MRAPVALVATAALVLTACRERRHEPPPPIEVPPALVAKVVHGSFHAMGTSIAIEVWTDRELAARGAMDDALAEIRRLEALMTTWSESSDVARVNAAAGGAAVKVSDEVLEVLAASRRVHDESRGVFDVTFHALHGLWRFDHDAAGEVPSDGAIAARLPLIDGKKVELDAEAKTVRLPVKGMAINVGGIAKGYAVDKAAAVLARHGFADVLIQAGGDLLARGRKGGEPWRVGIRDPRGAPGDFFAFAPVRDAAFSTAGDYERAFVREGVRHHHILDPRTGKPATACRSVTVLAPDAFTADQLDDAIFILGPVEGLKLLAKHPGTGAVVVDQDNVVHVSDGLKAVVEIVHPPTPGI